MSITAAQTACNANALRKFGGMVQLDGVGVTGDFTSGNKERSVGDMPIAACDPMCTVADGDMPANPVGKLLVHGGVTYTVREIHADGLGLTVLTLQRGV